MTAGSQQDASAAPPTRLGSAVFAGKVAAHRLLRLASDFAVGPHRLESADRPRFRQVVAESRTPLWADEAIAERALQAGKVENLRIAAGALNGLVLPAGAVFSFWRHVGPPIAARGFVAGRMLQQGCMVPAVGGGLCQLSNALYDVALSAGCTIVERHPHSRVVPGSAAARGRDATVAWNYVDLRFAAERDLRLVVSLNADELVVRLDAADGMPVARAWPARAEALEEASLRNCATCGETGCFRHGRGGLRPAVAKGAQAFLVDEAWPEFQDYVAGARRPGDRLGVPIDGARLRLSRYAWKTDGFERVDAASLVALRRAASLRLAGPQGAARRDAELRAAGRIAQMLSRLLDPDVRQVTVAQSLLPYLWRAGRLGGREVAVLMTRLPMAVLQKRLDLAAAVHPDQPTLADFRAPAWLVDCETEALAAAARVITPHAQIAELFADRAVRLEWQRPPATERRAPAPFVAFPGPTVARKGAYVLREAVRALGLAVMPLGAELEGADFWRGVRVQPAGDWRQATVFVQPALVEDQPRRLLAALAAGVPVIATNACGLPPQPGLTLIRPDDVDALAAALAEVAGLS